MVRSPEAVAGLPVGDSNWSVVAAVGRVFAPSVGAADAADGQKRARAQSAIGPPPEPDGTEPPARGGAVALAFVRPRARSAQREGDAHHPGRQPPLGPGARLRCDPDRP